MSSLQRRDIEGVEDMDCLSNMLDVLTAKQGELVMLITGGIDPNWYESILQIKVINISSMPRQEPFNCIRYHHLAQQS